MPWTAADADKHTKKATTDKLKRQWARVANSARQSCIDDGGEADECDASAIKQANAAVAEADAPIGGPDQCVCPDCGYTVDKERGVPCRSIECPKCGATLIAKEDEAEEMDNELQEAVWDTAYVNDLPDSSFALVLPGGKKDDEGKTVPRSLRKLPYKDASGKVDLPHLRNALARAPQMKGVTDAQRKGAIAKLNKAAKTHLKTHQEELAKELFGYVPEDQPMYVPSSPALSFADLSAARDASDRILSLQERADDLQMMVNTILWEADIADRSGALEKLFAEFVGIVRETLGEQPPLPEEPEEAVEEAAESSPVDLAEQAAMLSVSETTIDDLAQFDALLTEQQVELTDPRRAPVMVDFAIIRPGHGNQKDKRYYPAEMLERDGGAFEGVDVYVTNHDPDEKTERNKVGRFRNISGLREEGLVGTAILYDPDVAEKARNRADAGELGTLHCSILATGTGKKAEIDGREVTVIEAITQVHSVDLVSKAGAGGHAIALTESDGGTMNEQDKKDQEQEDQPLAEQEEAQPEVVEIRESDTKEEPQPLSEDAVAEILEASSLDEKSRHWLKWRTYQDEDAVKKAIEEMQAFIAEIAPDAGQPFALGESAPAAQVDVPKILTREELEERAYERTKRVLSEIEPAYGAQL